MTCELGDKLRKAKLAAESKFKSVSLPVSTEPLNGKNLPGNYLSSEDRKEIQNAKIERKKTKDAEAHHIMNCSNCK